MAGLERQVLEGLLFIGQFIFYTVEELESLSHIYTFEDLETRVRNM